MSETGPQPHDADGGRPRSAGRRTLGWLVGIVLAALALLAVMHILIRPIPPGQDAPAGHFGEPCGACHLVTSSADPVEVK